MAQIYIILIQIIILSKKYLRPNEVENLKGDFSKAKKMSLDTLWFSDYIIALNEQMIEYPMWWENIKTPEQVRML